MPVQSSILSPKQGQVATLVEKDGKKGLLVQGYAWSGGGKGITRVDVSCDGGKSWTDAELIQNKQQKWGKQWAWYVLFY